MFVLDRQYRIIKITPSITDWLPIESEQLQNTRLPSIVAEEEVLALQTALSTIQEMTEQTSRTISCHLEIDDQLIPVKMELSSINGGSTFDKVYGTIRRNIKTGGDNHPESQWIQLRNFIELFDDATVLFEMVDGEPIARAVNSAFEETFGYRSKYIIDEKLNHYIVPIEYKTEAKRINEQLLNGESVTKSVTRRTTVGNQEFAYRGLPVNYGTERGEDNMFGLGIYAEISEEQQARQHLQVLHRVLRHNLRNELTVILGMSDKIATEAETNEIREAADLITEKAEKLAGVSEKARMAEDILGEPPSETTIDVGRMAKKVVSNAREKWPEATITGDIETPLPVATGVEFRDALENLVENGIKHNSEEPTVLLTTRKQTPIYTTTRESGQNVIITVEDDGPGIPKHERGVIFENENMTQLKHGSGLGLWVVRWVVESTGGTVSYERENGWTKIIISLPLVGERRGL